MDKQKNKSKQIWNGVVVALGIIIILSSILSIFEVHGSNSVVASVAIIILVGVGLYKFINKNYGHTISTKDK